MDAADDRGRAGCGDLVRHPAFRDDGTRLRLERRIDGHVEERGICESLDLTSFVEWIQFLGVERPCVGSVDFRWRGYAEPAIRHVRRPPLGHKSRSLARRRGRDARHLRTRRLAGVDRASSTGAITRRHGLIHTAIRVDSGRAVEQPVSGCKPVETTPWDDHLLKRWKAYLGSHMDGTRRTFFERGPIAGIGARSGDRRPRRRRWRRVGMMDLLDAGPHTRPHMLWSGNSPRC